MRKQQICFIFLFFGCLLMPFVASVQVVTGSDGAELTLTIPSPPPIGDTPRPIRRFFSPNISVVFIFTLLKEDGTGVSGQTVTFSVSPNDGTASLSTASTTTDSDGSAWTILTLGNNASGQYSVTATLDDGRSISKGIPVGYIPPEAPPEPEAGPGTTADFKVESFSSGPPYTISSGGSFTFGVKVSEDGSPVSGQGVTFSVSPNDGIASVSPTSATTDSNGKAQTTLSLSGDSLESTYTVFARLDNIQGSSGLSVAVVTGTVQGSSSSPPTSSPSTEQATKVSTSDESSTDNTQAQQAAPQSSTGNTPAQQAAPQSSTGNTSPAAAGSTGNTPGQQAAPEGSTGNTQGTPRSVLVVSIPVISKTVLDSGESFTLSVTVENTSEGLSPETILRYYRGSDVGVSGTEVGKKTVSPISAMGTSDVSISLTAPDAPGTYLYYACISGVTGTGNTCTPNSVQLTVQGEPQDTSEPQGTSKYDVNGDGAVDIEDAALVVGAFGTNTAKYDVDGDGRVDVADLLLIITNRQEAASAPSVIGMKFTAAQMDRIQAQVSLLAATNDRSPVAMQTLAYLRSLIAVARPEKTQLLTNYPNPFNPETWIPYRLAVAANVTLTIYDINGQAVRQLALGHQAIGIYESRSRAAYWDGRNAFGEPVASGLYFYTLTAGDFTATRKMLIRK